jgi:hypothetical protein
VAARGPRQRAGGRRFGHGCNRRSGDQDFAEFAGEWQEWLAAITPTLTARPIAAGSFYALTPTCERFDVITERVSG